MVAAARANRVQVLFTVWGTPPWAADPNVPQGTYPADATQPADPGDFAAFGAAAAARYAPRGVHLWEAWNEPNIPLFLRPQYRREGGAWVPVSPTTYSRLLSGFYRAVKAVDPTATIGGAVTAPVGDRCPSSCPDSADGRVTPIAFLKGLAQPGNRPPMDVYSHHPYPITGPRDATFAGANYVDLYNLHRLEAAIDRTYLRGKRLWLTELGFSTRPVKEYPTSFSEPQQAQYLADAYRRLLPDRRVALVDLVLPAGQHPVDLRAPAPERGPQAGLRRVRAARRAGAGDAGRARRERAGGGAGPAVPRGDAGRAGGAGGRVAAARDGPDERRRQLHRYASAPNDHDLPGALGRGRPHAAPAPAVPALRSSSPSGRSEPDPADPPAGDPDSAAGIGRQRAGCGATCASRPCSPARRGARRSGGPCRSGSSWPST